MAALLLSIATGAVVATGAAGDGSDTSVVRIEIGATSDVTNEQYFEDAFLDTVALGRRLVSDPESRVAGLFRTALDGSRTGGSVRYRVHNELSLGDKIQRDEFWLDWRHVVSDLWVWSLSPRAEFRRDHSFGRDLDEARASALLRVRRNLSFLPGSVELSAQGDWLRTRGVGADFLPDRNAGRLGLLVARTPLWGSDVSVGYDLWRRDFPDSATRNHLEHRGSALWRRDWRGGHILQLGLDVARRRTLEPAPTSRDNFWEAGPSLDGTLSFGPVWGLMLRGSAEALRYDHEDTTLFFDYQVVRAFVAPQRTGRIWTVRVGPRGELLSSPREPSEQYRELAAAVELEWVGLDGVGSVAPAAGWRDYSGDASVEPSVGGAMAIPVVRSSYAFYQLDLMAEQSLPGAVRISVYCSGRLEKHTDAASDARSLYISFALRRLL